MNYIFMLILYLNKNEIHYIHLTCNSLLDLAATELSHNWFFLQTNLTFFSAEV